MYAIPCVFVLHTKYTYFYSKGLIIYYLQHVTHTQTASCVPTSKIILKPIKWESLNTLIIIVTLD